MSTPAQEQEPQPPYTADQEAIEKDIPIDDCIFRSYLWKAQPENWKGRVLFVHGYRDNHILYYELADKIVNAGFDFFFYYQRGEGESRLTNKSKGVSNDYYAYKAIDDMVNYNLKELNDEGKDPTKFHLMGLSMGGGLTLNYACHGKYKSKFKSFTAIAPLIQLHKSTYPGIFVEGVVRTICAFPFGKKLRVNSPLNLEHLTGDKEYQDYISATQDPEKLTGAFVEARDFILRGRGLLKEHIYSTIDTHVPMLICHGEDDHINDIEGSKSFHSSINTIDGMSNKTLKTYPNARHHLVIDTPEIRNKVIADIVQFLTENQ